MGIELEADPKEVGKRVSEIIPNLLNFERDLASVAIHAATELGFRSQGIDAGSAACSALVSLISDPEDRKVSVEERARTLRYDPMLTFIAFTAFRESDYLTNCGENPPVSVLLKAMDHFAEELEHIERIPKERLSLLNRSCLRISAYPLSSRIDAYFLT